MSTTRALKHEPVRAGWHDLRGWQYRCTHPSCEDLLWFSGTLPSLERGVTDEEALALLMDGVEADWDNDHVRLEPAPGWNERQIAREQRRRRMGWYP